MFSDFDMHPQDMNFKVYAAGEEDSFSNEFFNERLQITTSHAIESSVPGKSLKWIVQETNSKRLLDSVDLDPLQSILNLVMSGWDMSPNSLGLIAMRLWDSLLFPLNLLVSITLEVSYLP